MIIYKLNGGLTLEQDGTVVMVKENDRLRGFINGVVREEMGFYRIYVNISKTEFCTAVFAKGGD